MKPLSIGDVVKWNNWFSTYIPNTENRRKNGKSFLKIYTKKEFVGKDKLKRKLAELFINEKAVGFLVDFLKSIEMSVKKGAKKWELE